MSLSILNPEAESFSQKYHGGVARLVCIGSGFVGGCLGAVMAYKLSNQITVVDIDADRIAAWNSEQLPLSEPDLDRIVNWKRMPMREYNTADAEGASINGGDIRLPIGHTYPADTSHTSDHSNLRFTTNILQAIKVADMIFICVNTPSKWSKEGEGADLDLHDVKTATKAIAEYSTHDKTVVVKSTVPCGTVDLIQRTLDEHAADGVRFEVLSNPEFLAEGHAIRDLLHPDRIVIGSRPGASGQLAAASLASLYATWVPLERIILMDVASAELAKLASNAFLAQRVSAANALSAVCEKVGADITQVTQICGLDYRIGRHMLEAGPGFGGGCLAKDVSALVWLANSQELAQVANFWRTTLEINDYQKRRIANLIRNRLNGNLRKKRIAILGFTYKRNTKDCRNSPAIDLTHSLTADHACVAIHDPQVQEDKIAGALGISEPSSAQIEVCKSLYEACEDAAVAVLLVDWDKYGYIDWSIVASGMHEPKLVYDARNVLDYRIVEAAGLRVEVVGRGASTSPPDFRREW